MPELLNRYPDFYQDWVFEALRLRPGDEISDAILEPLSRLSRTWLAGDPEEQRSCLKDPEALRAYACYYMTINMPKLWFMLDRCQPVLESVLAEQPELKVAEFGCGPGTFLWAFLFYLQIWDPRVLARLSRASGIDDNMPALETAENLARGLRNRDGFAHLRPNFIRGNWQPRLGSDDDVIIFGNTLTESSFKTLDWVEELQAKMIIVIEPGTVDSFHHIRPIRDKLMDLGWHINFPCTSHHPCPMKPTNWCHFHINRFTHPYIQRMSAKSRRLNPRHNFSGFVFSRHAAHRPDEWRLLSTLRRVKRTGIRYVCDGEHMRAAVLGRRDKNDANRAFIDAVIGDRIRMRFETGKDAFLKSKHIRSEDTVDITDTWSRTRE